MDQRLEGEKKGWPRETYCTDRDTVSWQSKSQEATADRHTRFFTQIIRNLEVASVPKSLD